ncbi:MAG: DNA repair protein RadA [Spirochaetales bacterium]|nr:DNA repair protein RadA [Spirochaetales bacterium]
MKQKTVYSCKSCGHRESKWLGRCPECGEWNTFTEEAATKKDRVAGTGKEEAFPTPINAIELTDEMRMNTGMEEMDGILGGGLIRGSTILVGGDPGIGKSTLMLQLASSLESRGRILYVSGEESMSQIKLRAERLSVRSDTIEIFCETNLERILKVINDIKPVLVVIDSIQTIHSEQANSVPGSVAQVKFCSFELNEKAKERGFAIFLIGHVTKEGLIAGPKNIEHLVDTVLYFDQMDSDVRVIRSVKNRFGSTQELGLFRMTEHGLIQVNNPSSLFLEHRDGEPPNGVVIAPVYEGSRVLLVEFQSLVIPAKGGMSRVYSDKVDSRRVSRLAAVLEKYCQVPFSEMDIYVNIAGGIKIEEVGVDLPLCLSLYSARTGLSLPPLTAVTGEVSLAGEIRTVKQIERRMKSVLDLGFKRLLAPREKSSDTETRHPENFIQAGSVQEAVRLLFGKS